MAPEPIDAMSDEKMKTEEGEKNRESLHFGEQGIDIDAEDQVMDATWSEVYDACCNHSGEEWAWIGVGMLAVCFFLYWFLFGLELLGTGAKVMSGCRAGALFGDDTNPIAGLMIGIMATVLLQSSSTTTSIVVSLVPSVISVDQGIYMIMGANIGTSVTNTIVAIGQMGDGDQLELAFAGATVHDMFNFMTVAVLLPVEVITGYLHELSEAMTRDAETRDGESWEGPVDKYVAPLADRVIRSNSGLIRAVASNDGDCEPGGGYYPIICEGGVESKEACTQVGLITCSSDTGDCPLFFNQDASASDDKVSGGVVFFIAIMILFSCLIGLVSVLQKMLLGMSTRIVYKATDLNGYLAIVVGAGITMIVQSSSITTSTLTPLVGMGALRLEQMLPLTLGANIGTTMTAITSALVADEVKSLQVALAHLFFNITGIIIFYPIPFMRAIPLYAARKLGKTTRIWRGFPLVYIAVMFIFIPMLFLGLSWLYEQKIIGYTVLGIFLTFVLAAIIAYAAYWLRYNDGVAKCTECMQARERKRVAFVDLPDDMVYLKAKVAALLEHTGLPADAVEEHVPDVKAEEEEVEA